MKLEARMTAEQQALNRISPCGIYCRACPKLSMRQSCRGCRLDSRHDRCDIYECCVILGGKLFCFECEYFPCRRLQAFASANAGMRCGHHRHIAIESLILMRDVGILKWIDTMEGLIARGEYEVNRVDDRGRPDLSPCSCKKTRLPFNFPLTNPLC